MILAANHASHLDTGLLLSSLPRRAAPPYDRRGRSRLLLRPSLEGRRSGPSASGRSRWNGPRSIAAPRTSPPSLINDGWSLIIFPEGGRTADGWGREFKGGASYLAKRCGVPVIPVHIRGTRAVLAKSSSRFRPGSTEIRLGDALIALEHEDARKFAARIEQAVAALADEAESDWWSARRRAAAGTTPPFRGPQASAWRREWALPDSARKDQRGPDTSANANLGARDD